jgi:hypothetical protein
MSLTEGKEEMIMDMVIAGMIEEVAVVEIEEAVVETEEID